MSTTPFKRMSLALLTTLLLAGCATEKINWAARVGSYTYTQAVHDLGPPQHCDKLTDGSIVAEWMTERGQAVVSPNGPYWASPYQRFGPASPPDYSVTQFPSQYVQLTFKPDGTLASEREFSR